MRAAGSDFHKAFKIVKLREAKDRVVVARDWGEGEEGFAKHGDTISVTQAE